MSPRFCSLPAPSLLCCKEEGLRERNPRETDRTWSNHITLKVFIRKLYWIKSLSLIKRVGRHTVLSLVLPRGGCLLELRKELPYFGLGVRLSSHAANQLHSKLCNSILENYFLLFLFFFSSITPLPVMTVQTTAMTLILNVQKDHIKRVAVLRTEIMILHSVR